MKVSSLSGAANATRTALLHMQTQTVAAVANPVARPTAMAPPPRASSFGGADPRAMFEALVEKVDSNGDGKLSLDEVNALNQGGLLSRSFGRVDSNGNGTLSSDEIAAIAPWGGNTLPSGQQGGERGADATALFDKLTDHLTAAQSAEARSAASRADFVAGMADTSTGQALTRLTSAAVPMRSTANPGTLMESMVLALSTAEDDTTPTAAIRPAPALR